jgi:hypothetical protein
MSRGMRWGLALAVIHFALFSMTVGYTLLSSQEQASLVLAFWVVADLPVSLIDFVFPKTYMLWVDSLSKSSQVFGNLFYPPYFVHGVLGTLWWFFLPGLAFAMRRIWKHDSPDR